MPVSVAFARCLTERLALRHHCEKKVKPAWPSWAKYLHTCGQSFVRMSSFGAVLVDCWDVATLAEKILKSFGPLFVEVGRHPPKVFQNGLELLVQQWRASVFQKSSVLMWATHVLMAWAHEWGHLGYACAAMSATGSLPQGGHKGSSLSIKDSKQTIKDPKQAH